jgi:putative intracellular protease/amidase
MPENALIIVTAEGTLGETGKPTGFYWEELAIPYWSLRDAGYDVTFAAPRPGTPPADPASDAGAGERPAAVTRFMEDERAMEALAAAVSIGEVVPSDYAVVFLPGGHGTMWDFAQTEAVRRAVAQAWEAGAVVGAVCHGPSGLLNATLSDGTPLIAGRRVTGFTNAEEAAAGLTDVVPFLLETELAQRGARVETAEAPFAPFAVRDGRLVTGQNPASSEQVAEQLLAALRQAPAAA